MSRLYDEFQAEQAKKQEDLLQVPRALADAMAMIDNMHAELSETRAALAAANTVRAKLPELFIGAVLGAFISALFGLFTGLLA